MGQISQRINDLLSHIKKIFNTIYVMVTIVIMTLERCRRGFRMGCMSRLMGDDGESRVRIAACIDLPIAMMITIITIIIV